MNHSKKAILCLSLLSTVALSACSDIKFVEKVSTSASQSEPSEEFNDGISTSNSDEDWRTQTLSETTAESLKTNIPLDFFDNDTDLELPSISTTKETSSTSEYTKNVSASGGLSISANGAGEFDDDNYYKIEGLEEIVFTKKTELFKSSKDLDPFTVPSGQTAYLIGYTVDSRWYIINFSDNKFLIRADEDNFVRAEDIVTEATTRATTTTQATTVPTEAETEVVTVETTTTSPPETTPTTTTTTQEIITTTTTPYVEPVTTTTTTVITTTAPITQSEEVSTSPTGLKTTGNRGGIPFPDDTSKTSKVFGITFVNMEEMIVLVNDVYISSGPGVPNEYNGYISLGILEAGTEMKCLGMSYDGWLRLRLPNNKIGFVLDTDAVLVNDY